MLIIAFSSRKLFPIPIELMIMCNVKRITAALLQ